VTIRDELKQLKKERILEEAARLFYERGFTGTTLDAIAEALDMTKPFIYGAYERKLDILIDLTLRAVRTALTAIRDARKAGGTPSSQLRAYAQAYTETLIANQAGVAVYFREETSIPPKEMKRINALKGEFDRELIGLIGEGIAAGEFQVEDLRMAAFALDGMMNWAYVWYRQGGRLTPAEIGRQMAGFALRLVGAADGDR
jgi:AcrR family transcriptional regulator